MNILSHKQLFRQLAKQSNRKIGNITKLPFASKLDLQDLNQSDLPLQQIIRDQIMQNGPMTFSQFMSQCLLHEEHGYYMKNDVFNAKGDFITSPEISQMFGEIIGLWIAVYCEKTGIIDQLMTKSKDRKLRILEFGPGRGTLMVDITRTLGQLGLLNNIEISFIEFSPFLKKIQQQNVQKQLSQFDIWLDYQTENPVYDIFKSTNPDNYFELKWYSMYEQFLKENFGDLLMQSEKQQSECPTIILAHEFFDALPVHVFQHTGNKNWAEKLITNNFDSSKTNAFDWILSDENNQNVQKILNPTKQFSNEQIYDTIKVGDQLEISKQSGIIMNSIAELISKTNGAALVIDYGEDHAFTDSIRGIRKHKFLKQDDILQYPGECDLSVYVNFNQLKTVSEKVQGIKAYDLITQGHFLESMGIKQRLQILSQGKDNKQIQDLHSECERLVDGDQMGQIYKVMYVGKEENGEIFPFIDQNSGQPQVFY